MKALFICLTDYQMLNALNIKTHILDSQAADILFFDNKKGHKDLAKRLQQTGVFENIYLHQFENVEGLHRYFRKQTDEGFLSAFRNSVEECIYNMRVRLQGASFRINAKLYDNKIIDFSIYDRVFGIVTKDIVADVMNLVLKSNVNAEINFIEDGTSTYWRKSIRCNIPFKNIYLYQPKLANYYYEGYEDIIKPIPKIDFQDGDFRKLINYVFAYNTRNVNYSNKVIFFDQNWDPMPEYLKNLSGLKKIIFNNPYKKHLKESKLYERKMFLFRILADLFSNGVKDVIVKLHPRSADSFAEDYLKSNCSLAENVKAPWEVFEDNCIFDNNIWVTVSSTALCSLKTAFKNKNEKVKLLFLYKLVYDNSEKYRDDREFFASFKAMYGEDVIIPESEEEFKEWIDKEWRTY